MRSWRGWDDYHVIIWSTGSPANYATWAGRLRELGFDAEQCTRGNSAAPKFENGLGFYVENLVPELAFLNSRQSIYDADYKGYTTTRDKSYLVRKPCYHDPAFLATVGPQLQSYIRQYAADSPLLHNLRDELSIGRFVNPMDYCFCPHSMNALREWLQKRYESLDALNAEWETSFGSWDEVTPLTTYELKDREKQALWAGTPENYAPWADHREFMEQTWAETLGKLRELVREIDPDTPVGIEGTQMPSAWGGYDLWQLSKNIDWVEPYDIGTSREIFRSFLPPKTPVLSTVFGADSNTIRRELWRLLLDGDRGTIVWDDDDSGGRAIEKFTNEMAVTGRGRTLQSIFSELKPLAAPIMALERKDDRIAIHYSQASIRAHWMFDSREDGSTWPKRYSSYEASHSRLARARDGFVRLVEDLGLQYNFVSYEQITAGELIAGGYKVLLMPQSVAMSAAECQAIEEFVRAGGTVIADNMTATMDEHGKRLAAGGLDTLFGIERSDLGWTESPQGGTLPVEEGSAEGVEPLHAYETGLSVVAGEAQASDDGTPVIVQNVVDAGRAVYLNLDVRDYGRLRLTPPAGQALLELLRGLMTAAGVEPRAQVLDASSETPAPGVRVWRFGGEDGLEYLALMRNPEPDAASFGDFGYPSNEALEQPVDLAILLGDARQVRNFRTGDDYGTIARVDLTLDPFSPIILELRTPPPPPPEEVAPPEDTPPPDEEAPPAPEAQRPARRGSGIQ